MSSITADGDITSSDLTVTDGENTVLGGDVTLAIKTDAVTSAKIADGTIDEADLAPDAVTAAKLAPDVAGTGLTQNETTGALEVPVFTGATLEADGTAGLVPQPGTDDVEKFLKGDGTWGTLTSNVTADNVSFNGNYDLDNNSETPELKLSDIDIDRDGNTESSVEASLAALVSLLVGCKDDDDDNKYCNDNGNLLVHNADFCKTEGACNSGCGGYETIAAKCEAELIGYDPNTTYDCDCNEIGVGSTYNGGIVFYLYPDSEYNDPYSPTDGVLGIMVSKVIWDDVLFGCHNKSLGSHMNYWDLGEYPSNVYGKGWNLAYEETDCEGNDNSEDLEGAYLLPRNLVTNMDGEDISSEDTSGQVQGVDYYDDWILPPHNVLKKFIEVADANSDAFADVYTTGDELWALTGYTFSDVFSASVFSTSNQSETFGSSMQRIHNSKKAIAIRLFFISN